MDDKAPLVGALCTGPLIVPMPLLVAFQFDSAEGRLELVCHCMHGVEKPPATYQCRPLAEERYVIGRCIDAAGTAQVSIAPGSERFLGGPDTTLARKAG